MVTARDWLDFVSYCADFPEQTQLYIFRVHKEECEEYFQMMKSRIDEFFDEVKKSEKLIRGK